MGKRIGGCRKCGGDVIRDSVGDLTCVQCGTICEYAKTSAEVPLENVARTPNGRKAPKYISE